MAKKIKSAATGTKKKQPRKKTSASASSLEVQIRAAVGVVDVADSLTAPLKRSIENLLRLAASSVGSDEASVLVRDGNKGGLKFLVAIGEVADKIMKVRIPPGKGIAGFVFSSGQPMAVTDVAQEETFYAEVDRATGYSTQTILATPLRTSSEMVGVLEFVNRLGDPPYEPFMPDEMDKAAHYADAIATLVDAYEAADLVEILFERMLSGGSKGAAKKEQASSGTELRKWLKKVRAAPEHRDLMLMAVSLRDIASRGDAERELARDMLDALARYTEKNSASGMTYLGF
ncbi:MAG: GAF domain-containing protein [Pyrinomonadaceae bacterium]|nr:GAF domain-containing protein [Pyrinomonadaceae bacterium]